MYFPGSFQATSVWLKAERIVNEHENSTRNAASNAGRMALN
jgi:hypothetical protein